jgi:hypothetical protein
MGHVPYSENDKIIELKQDQWLPGAGNVGRDYEEGEGTF